MLKQTLLSIPFITLSTVALAGHTNSVLEASLDGHQEVSGAKSKRISGDPNGRGEAYVFGIDNDPNTLCYVLTVDKIQLVGVSEGMAAHIHKGAVGSNGPVVAILAGPEDGNAADCLTEGLEANKFPMGPVVAEILAHPEDYYINVHNPDYPAGAIRGQLAVQSN
jgi:hypothetical protein